MRTHHTIVTDANRHLGRHAVMQIVLVLYGVLLSAGGMKIAQVAERAPHPLLVWIYHYGPLLALFPIALFACGIRDRSDFTSCFLTPYATLGTYFFLVMMIGLSMHVLIRMCPVLVKGKQQQMQSRYESPAPQ